MLVLLSFLADKKLELLVPTGEDCKRGCISEARGELAEDECPCFGLQGGYAISHQGSGPRRHGSWEICLPCDISRRSVITRAAMQSLEKQILRSRLATSTKLKQWSCTTHASYQYSCMVRTAGRYQRGAHVGSMRLTSSVCVCCLASNGTDMSGSVFL